MQSQRKLFLDCEFNGLGGELLSMALVSDDSIEWYEVLEPEHAFNSWVKENVVPKFGKDPICRFDFLHSFCDFVTQFDGAEIVADWPADFEHFAKAITDIGARDSFVIPIECTMRLVRGDDMIEPENPHNALSDARALRDWYLKSAAIAA